MKKPSVFKRFNFAWYFNTKNIICEFWQVQYVWEKDSGNNSEESQTKLGWTDKLLEGSLAVMMIPEYFRSQKATKEKFY